MLHNRCRRTLAPGSHIHTQTKAPAGPMPAQHSETETPIGAMPQAREHPGTKTPAGSVPHLRCCCLPALRSHTYTATKVPAGPMPPTHSQTKTPAGSVSGPVQQSGERTHQCDWRRHPRPPRPHPHNTVARTRTRTPIRASRYRRRPSCPRWPASAGPHQKSRRPPPAGAAEATPPTGSRR